MSLEDYDLDELDADNPFIADTITGEEKEHFSLFHIYEATFLGKTYIYDKWVKPFEVVNMEKYFISIDDDPDANYEYIVTLWEPVNPTVVIGRIGYNVNPRVVWDLHDEL